MKKITLVLLALAMSLGMNLSAQDKYGPNKDECIKYLSYYQEYYKAKNYDDALPNWRTAMKLCPPTASQNMLLNGMTLLSREINKTKDAGARKALVDSLLMLNDLRAEYYPNYAVAAMNTKGQYMTQFFKDPKTLYEGLGQIVAANKEQTKPSLLLLQLNSAIDMFKAGNLGAEEVINTYIKRFIEVRRIIVYLRAFILIIVRKDFNIICFIHIPVFENNRISSAN